MAKGRKSKVRYRTAEWEGESYRLAVLDKGGQLPDEEKVKIAELVCKMYATDKYNLQSCLEACGVRSRGTWYKWTETVEQIEQLFINAQKEKDSHYMSQLKERARTSLERFIDGFTREVTEREAEPVPTGEVDDEGNPIMALKTTKVKKKEVFIKPSMRAIEHVLFNADARNFEKNPKPVEKMNKDVDIPVIKWVDNNEVEEEI